MLAAPLSSALLLLFTSICYKGHQCYSADRFLPATVLIAKCQLDCHTAHGQLFLHSHTSLLTLKSDFESWMPVCFRVCACACVRGGVCVCYACLRERQGERECTHACTHSNMAFWAKWHLAENKREKVDKLLHSKLACSQVFMIKGGKKHICFHSTKTTNLLL